MINYSFSMYEFEYFLLILARVASFVFVAPFFSMNNTPRRVKTAFSFFFAILIYETTMPHEAIECRTVLEYALIVAHEVFTGLIIGLAVNICTHIVTFAGRMIDMEIGLAMASEYDPLTKESVSISGMLYQYMVLLILVVSNMHQYLIKAFVETYTLIPVNGAVFHSDRMLSAIISFMSDYINIGFRICLPIFCVLLITNVILGIMAKVAPQMNMFAVGMQIKLLFGLGVMFLTIGMLPYVSDFIFTEMKTMMVTFVEAMMA